jgi:hypothetical protein
MASGFPYISLLQVLALDNERLLPQQSVSLFSNIDDIESWILSTCGTSTYLTAIDMPWTERTRVMRELRCMGITAGSMFPGA